MRTLIFCLIFVFGFGVRANAFEIPPMSSNVVDLSGILKDQERHQIESRIQELRVKSDIYAAVLIVPSVDSYSIEQAATDVFRQWKLGREKEDNGLLLIFAMKDHRARIEVGYGLEGQIPDIYARHILDDTILPLF